MLEDYASNSIELKACMLIIVQEIRPKQISSILSSLLIFRGVSIYVKAYPSMLSV